MKSLIFHPQLRDMISRVVKNCLICTISAPKQVKTLIGSQYSNYYVPSQCIVVDSAYFPRSQYGYKNALIIVDAATGYVIVYPSQNLLAATVKKHILTYLSSHMLPEKIKLNFGSEFKKDLDKFIAKYGVQLSATKTYAKGSTAQAESVIK